MQNKDQDADFEKVIHESRPSLLAALQKMLPTCEAEEVFQEACLRLYVSQHKLDEASMRPYLFRIARNLAVDCLRHESVVSGAVPLLKIHQELTSEKPSAEQQSSMDEERQMMVEAINAMPTICRQVFIYRKIDGLSHREIAEKMHLSTNTIENHLTRGMKFCRDYFLRSRSPSPLQANNQKINKAV